MPERMQRLNEIMQREANAILHRKFPREAIYIVISHIEIAPDLHNAQVFFTVVDPQQKSSAEAFLRKIKGELKFALAQRLQLRQFPEFHFKWDEKIAGEQRIYAILDGLNGGKTAANDA